MNQRGQNVVELTVLVAASMMALLLIFTLYSEQFGMMMHFNDYHTARASVRKLVDAANTVYYAGPGSEIQVLIEIPPSVIIEESGIHGKTVYLRMADGSDIIDVADVNINGHWQDDSRYFTNLRYDGNVVLAVERGYDLLGGTMFTVEENIGAFTRSFEIENTFDKELDFELDLTFPNSFPNKFGRFYEGHFPYKDELDFSLRPGETREVELIFLVLWGNPFENETGYIDVATTAEDYYWEERIYISIEYIPWWF